MGFHKNLNNYVGSRYRIRKQLLQKHGNDPAIYRSHLHDSQGGQTIEERDCTYLTDTGVFRPLAVTGNSYVWQVTAKSNIRRGLSPLRCLAMSRSMDIYLVEVENQSLLVGNACQEFTDQPFPCLLHSMRASRADVNTCIPPRDKELTITNSRDSWHSTS